MLIQTSYSPKGLEKSNKSKLICSVLRNKLLKSSVNTMRVIGGVGGRV